MERSHAVVRKLFPGTPAVLLLLLFLLTAGSALADVPHTILLKCAGSGYLESTGGKNAGILLDPESTAAAADGSEWTLEKLRRLPGFQLWGASLRWCASEVSGDELRCVISCGKIRSAPQYVLEGWNLWDVTRPVSAWLAVPGEKLRMEPLQWKKKEGTAIRKGSVFLQLTFSADAEVPDFPPDRIQADPVYEASLCMLEENHLFLRQYAKMTGNQIQPLLPLGVPYYYTGSNEDKFLNRYFPQVTTEYFKGNRMYLYGLDCAGMTKLVYQKLGRKAHPTILSLLHRGAGRDAVKTVPPEKWLYLLQPGDLIAVQHGSGRITNHIMMVLGTLRQFGWTEETAGEALPALDLPLVIHCGGDPFYYDRYQAYIAEKGYENTYPPDGGVTVSVIQQNGSGAPNSTDTFWGRHFDWYSLEGQPLLVFPLEDCVKMIWYHNDR